MSCGECADGGWLRQNRNVSIGKSVKYMLLFDRNKKGFSTTEYLVMLLILVTAMVVFKDYIIRGLTGRWKTGSDQIGFGRQYEPTDTVECAYDYQFNQGWYDITCVDNQGCPPGNKNCERLAISTCTATTFCQ